MKKFTLFTLFLAAAGILGAQEVDGIKFPSLRVVPMGPQQIESKLLEAVINYEVQESDFN
mgnify:CR=1 FL=1